MKHSVRTFLCLLLCLMMLPVSGLAQQAVTHSKCKYYSAKHPCDVIWYVDVSNRMHCEACRNHVENKEDPFDYVCITDWVPCTLNNAEDGECIVCGADYIKDITDDGYTDAYLTEMFMVCLMDGKSPLDVTITGNKADVTFSDYYKELLDANGIPVSESLSVPTTYTLKLSGTTFAYAGSAITPASLDYSSYGPGIWAQELGFLSVSKVTYANNDAPGTASATVNFTVSYKENTVLTKQLTVNFTITGDKEDDGYTDQEISSEDDAVNISGQLTQGSTVNVTPVNPNNSDYTDLMNSLDSTENVEVLVAMDVAIAGGSFNGGLELTFDVGAEHNGKTVDVWHLKDGSWQPEFAPDGSKAKVDNGKVTVSVDSLSPFVLLVNAEDDGNNGNGGTNPMPPTDPDQPSQPDAPSVPKTGDSSMPMLWITLMALAAIGFALTAKKRLGTR